MDTLNELCQHVRVRGDFFSELAPIWRASPGHPPVILCCAFYKKPEYDISAIIFTAKRWLISFWCCKWNYQNALHYLGAQRGNKNECFVFSIVEFVFEVSILASYWMVCMLMQDAILRIISNVRIQKGCGFGSRFYTPPPPPGWT